jgi:hypothetical protein
MPSTPIVGDDKTHDYAAFSDESHSDNNHNYMVIGGVLCRSADAHKLANRFGAIHSKSPYGEAIQWKSASYRKLSLYKEVIDLFFKMNSDQEMDFSCIVFDRRKIDHKKHSANDPEKGFFKFVYQHHLSHVRRYGVESSFRCFHGNMDTKYNMSELKRCLNGGSPKRGLKIFNPYVQVEFSKVKSTRCLQVADLLIGAVGYITNQKHLSSPLSAKTELAEYVQQKAPIPHLGQPTARSDWGFGIWHFRL